MTVAGALSVVVVVDSVVVVEAGAIDGVAGVAGVAGVTVVCRVVVVLLLWALAEKLARATRMAAKESCFFIVFKG